MKAKLTTTLLALAAVSINLHAAPSTALPAPLPDFMDQAQLAKWNADKAATAQTASSSAPEYANQFYTGKPYVADAGGYIYKYRTYNPEMSRWTSADPSGFPDGVNNFSYVNNSIITSFDPNGFAQVTFTFTSSSISFTVPGTSTTLQPTASGKFTANEDASGDHFIGTANGSWTSSIGGSYQYQANSPSKTAYTYSLDSTFTQTDQGTTAPNTEGEVEDYVTVVADFTLTQTVPSSDRTGWVTSASSVQAYTYTFYGNPYE